MKIKIQKKKNGEIKEKGDMLRSRYRNPNDDRVI
jgi:hypothetical protein